MDRNITISSRHCVCIAVATREGGVDRNNLWLLNTAQLPPSPPARVAWIETLNRVSEHKEEKVATREGGVDRNQRLSCRVPCDFVATREGGVYRNCLVQIMQTRG